eukprot:m.6375 g.6375  ORF g.6375 m.6375 type:complete len:184 (+) comp15703_c0_seq1:89-640(+)
MEKEPLLSDDDQGAMPSVPPVSDKTDEEPPAYLAATEGDQRLAWAPQTAPPHHQQPQHQQCQQPQYMSQHGNCCQQSQSNTAVVVTPPYGYQPQLQTITMVQTVPSQFFGLSLLTLFLCCWPIGIFALISSFRTKDRIAVRDFVGAARSSQLAKMLNIIGITIGICFYVFSVLSFIIYMSVKK